MQELYPDANVTSIQTILSLQYTYRVIQSRYDQVFNQYGLSESRFILLIFLYHADNGLSLSDLAFKLGVAKPTTSKLIRGMTTAKLVEKVADAQDKRGVKIHLTAVGQKLLEDFLPVNFQTMNRFVSNLSATEQQQLKQLLNKMVSPEQGQKDGGN
nr:MarR family winged helix-turn-helix transcriptional regulator [Secundilactobacillus folii]